MFSLRLVMQELIETEASERIGAGRHNEASPGLPQRIPIQVVIDSGRGCAAADPEAAEGLVLPGHLGAAAAESIRPCMRW